MSDKPLVIDIEPDSDQVYETSSGRSFRNPRLTVREEISEQIRLGYRCANCLERFSVAWPKVCNFCGVFVREQQALFYEKQYRGTETFAPTDWDAEIERMKEAHEREQREKK